MEEPSLRDYLAAQDAENGTNMSAWLTPPTPEPDEAQAIVARINAKAHAKAGQRIDAVKNGAAPRTESEREFVRVNKMIRRLEKPTFLDRIRVAFK